MGWEGISKLKACLLIAILFSALATLLGASLYAIHIITTPSATVSRIPQENMK